MNLGLGQGVSPAPCCGSPAQTGQVRRPALLWRRLPSLFRHGEAGLQRPAGAAFQAADATRDVHLQVHVDTHRTAAAAEVALDTLAGLEAKVEQTEPVE